MEGIGWGLCAGPELLRNATVEPLRQNQEKKKLRLGLYRKLALTEGRERPAEKDI